MSAVVTAGYFGSFSQYFMSFGGGIGLGLIQLLILLLIQLHSALVFPPHKSSVTEPSQDIPKKERGFSRTQTCFRWAARQEYVTAFTFLRSQNPQDYSITSLQSWLLTLDILGQGRLTKKFQTTIPKRARRLLGLDAHDLVVFVGEDGRVVLKKAEIRIK